MGMGIGMKRRTCCQTHTHHCTVDAPIVRVLLVLGGEVWPPHQAGADRGGLLIVHHAPRQEVLRGQNLLPRVCGVVVGPELVVDQAEHVHLAWEERW